MGARDDGNPFTPVLNGRTKYVASRTLTGPLPWVNSHLLDGDVPAAVAELRQDTDLTVLGSGELVRSLLAAGLVDVLVLSVHPLMLGTGRRLVTGGVTRWQLTAAVPTTTGVVIATYRTEEPRP